MITLRTRRVRRLRGAAAERRPATAPGVPPSISDPQTVVHGAVLATLLSHSGEWVSRRTERITLGEGGAVCRQVSVDFQVPGIVWAASPRDEPVLVPLALIDKTRTVTEIDPHGEAGEPLDVLDREEAAALMTAGLVALAQGAGTPVDDDLRRLAWRIAAGAPEESERALRAFRNGDTKTAARAWAHEPFRALAELLAGRTPLLVALRDADHRRVLHYSYEEHPPAAAQPARLGGLPELAARWLGWREQRTSCALSDLGDAASHRFDVEPGPDLEARVQVDARAPDDTPVAATAASADEFAPRAIVEVDGAPAGSRGVLNLRVRARRGDLLRLEPLLGLLAAVLLTGAWLALPLMGGGGRSAAALVVATPAVLGAYLGRPWGHPVLRTLLRGVRTLTIGVGVVSFVAAAVLAIGASTGVLRAVVGLAVVLAWAATALIYETRRRVTGAPILSAPFAERAPGVATDAEPAVEAPAVEGVDTLRLALLGLTIAVGLLIVAVADDAARDGRGGAYGLFWLGLLAIFVPALVHAFRSRSRRETVIALVLAGVGLYLVKVLHSPTEFTFHDEFSTFRTTVDIDRFGEPFHRNPLIPVHPFYPALELVTSAVANVTGLSIFTSGLLVIGVLRVALMVGLFLVFEAASSTRVAAVATILYATNPNFLFFDSQWAYESFALPLAIVAIAMVAGARADEQRSRARMRRSAWFTLPIVLTITIAHPLTSLALVLFLGAWAAIDTWMARRDKRPPRVDLRILVAAGGGFLVVWVALVAQKTGGYLGPVLQSAGSSLVDLVLGHSGPKRIFEGAGVPKTPIAEQLLGFAAVGLALAAVAAGVRLVWRRFEPLKATLALAGAVYPLTLPLRLTEDGTEISNRASEFVFIGIAFLAALALIDGHRRLKGRRAKLGVPLALAAAAVLFTGGVVIGWARYSRLPGDYLVIGDTRSVEPIGVEAARWSRAELGPGNRVVADRANGLLWGSIGRQEPQGGEILGRNVPRTITAPVVDADVKYALVKDDLRFLVVDRRLSTALPAVGVYFERDEPGAYAHTTPPALRALLKYDSVCPVGRTLDSGAVKVYDTRRMADQFLCDFGPGPLSPVAPRGGGAGPGVAAPRDGGAGPDAPVPGAGARPPAPGAGARPPGVRP